MRSSLPADQGPCSPRRYVTGDDLSVEGALRELPLVLRVEVRRLMLLIEHPNDDAKERREDRLVLSRNSRFAPPAFQIIPPNPNWYNACRKCVRRNEQ